MFGLGGDDSFSDAKNAVRKNQVALDNIALPDYLQFSPELQNYESADYELLQDDPILKSAQQSALMKLAGLAETGLSDVDAAGFEKARSIGNQVAKSQRASALQDAQARGIGGSGLEFMMKEAANQDAAQRAQEAGLMQASEGARQRALYQQAYGDQLSGVRNQNMQTEQANKGIINQFNTMNTQGRNQTNNANVNARNDAFKYNENLKDKNYGNQLARIGMNNANTERLNQINAAENEQRRGQAGAITGMVGAGIGAMYGGPAGAQAGYAAGNSLGRNF